MWLEKTKQIYTLMLHFMNCICLCENPRSGENKMDSSNLAVMLAPNLLHSGDAADKMNANMEKRLKLQAAVVHCLIENARNFGTSPDWRNTRVSCAAFWGVSRRLFLSLFPQECCRSHFKRRFRQCWAATLGFCPHLTMKSRNLTSTRA